MTFFPRKGLFHRVEGGAFVASNAVVTGDVTLGEDVGIWRDSKLRGNDVFDESLVNRLSTADVFIAVITPRYVKSEWCLKELTEFCRRHAEMGHHDFASRIFKVIKTPTPRGLFTDSTALMTSVGSQTVGEIVVGGRRRIGKSPS